MPTVIPPLKGWRVVFYPNDHRPPHVHVVGKGEHARFELFCDLGQVQLIAAYLTKQIARLCTEWGRIHGH